MKLPSLRRWRSRNHRGQGMVEFALILPLLVLFLVMAIDFGRVFFGWVALHNAVRIGADYVSAGNFVHWEGMDPDHAAARQKYDEVILNDLQSLNCDLPSPDPVPDPVFSGFADGDLVEAEVTCSFGLLTPLAEGILGGPVQMTVRTQFAINRTLIGGLPGGGGGGPPEPPPPCSAPVAGISTNPAESGGQVNINTGQSVVFTDDSEPGEDCGEPTYLWDFGTLGTENSIGPHTKPFTNPGPQQFRTFTVTLTVTTVYGSGTDSVTVRVRR